MKKSSFFYILIFVAFFNSCQKKESSAPAITSGNLLNDNAHIIDTLSIISITPSSLILNKTATTYRPKIGDILIVIPFSASQLGLLSKVTNVTENNSQINCNIVPSNLNEAFKQLNINHIYVDTFSSSGSFFTGSSLSVSFNANNTIANGIGLDGLIKFKIPTTKVEFVKRSGTLKPDKVLIQADFGIDESTLEIKNTSSSAINVITEKNLITFNLPTIMILVPVGPIVIPIPITQQLLIKILPISISGKAKWTVIPKISATLGVKYENSNWTNLSTYSIDASATPLYHGDFGPTLTVQASATIIKPVYEIKPYGLEVLKGFFEVPNKLDLAVQTITPNFSLKYKLDVTGGIKQSFWTAVEQEYSITGHLIEKTILQGNWPYIPMPGEVLSPTGRIWKDRNLGASRVAISSTDYLAYGNLYQWGRGSDGHELINWTSSTIGTPVNGVTNILSTTNSPGHSLFINPSSNPRDWRIPQNDNLWQGVNGINNPCPAGFRLPTEEEFNAERALFPTPDKEGAFASVLKLTVPGRRVFSSGNITSAGSLGYYWTSSIKSIDPTNATLIPIYLYNPFWATVERYQGVCIRCIKN